MINYDISRPLSTNLMNANKVSSILQYVSIYRATLSRRMSVGIFGKLFERRAYGTRNLKECTHKDSERRCEHPRFLFSRKEGEATALTRIIIFLIRRKSRD